MPRSRSKSVHFAEIMIPVPSQEPSLISVITSVVTQLSFAINNPFIFNENVSISYTLHTPEFEPVQFTNLDDVKLKIDSKRDLKILIHNFNTSDHMEWYGLMTEEYRTAEIYNVLALDFSKSFKDLTYADIVIRSKAFGNAVATTLVNLNKNYSVSYEKMHILAEGTGVHIAGSAGEKVYQLTGESLGRITGLDPDTQSYSEGMESGRLSPHDAKFVDIINVRYFSWSNNMARANYLINQNSYKCNYEEYEQLKSPAARLYAQTINGKGIKVQKCIDSQYWDVDCKKAYDEWGEHVGRKAFGDYVLANDKDGDAICKLLDIPINDIYAQPEPSAVSESSETEESKPVE